MKLLIVESPSKIKKIQTFLSKEWTVSASVGHVCDLPEKKMGIDLDSGSFEQEYAVYNDKKKVMRELYNLSKKADQIYMASDPDREGEAIAWHVARLLQLNMDDVKRVEFYSITKAAVLKAIENPRKIDMSLVDAYKARRAVDRVFGYQLSPEIQRFQMKSAGRCQTPCLNVVVKREREIQAFKPEIYYTLNALYEEGFKSGYAKEDGKGNIKPSKINTKEELDYILSKIKEKDDIHIVENISSKEIEEKAPPPFITSSIITAASTKFKFKPKQTSRVLQTLFQNGYITYIRTDSVEISKEGLDLARKVIADKAPELLPDKPVIYKVAKAAQGAHECIRPTHEDDSSKLSGDELKLYTLIRNRFLACQCKPARLEKKEVLFSTKEDIKFISRGTTILFEGYRNIYSDEGDDDKKDDNDESMDSILPAMAVGEEKKVSEYKWLEKATKPPKRYKLSTLTKEIEKLGIGRPSTFSSIVQTPLDRNYYKEGKGQYLFPTDLGNSCISVLEKTISKVILPSYTSDLEKSLDNISESKDNYVNFCNVWYKDWTNQLLEAKKSMITFMRENPGLIKISGDPYDKPCPECNGDMVQIKGRFGTFVKCTGCGKNITPQKKEDKLSEKKCPTCSTQLLERKGKFGDYYFCKECNSNLSDKKIKFLLSLKTAEKTGIKCPICSSIMVERTYKDKKTGENKSFNGCSTFPKCRGAIWPNDPPK